MRFFNVSCLSLFMKASISYMLPQHPSQNRTGSLKSIGRSVLLCTAKKQTNVQNIIKWRCSMLTEKPIEIEIGVYYVLIERPMQICRYTMMSILRQNTLSCKLRPRLFPWSGGIISFFFNFNPFKIEQPLKKLVITQINATSRKILPQCVHDKARVFLNNFR